MTLVYKVYNFIGEIILVTRLNMIYDRKSEKFTNSVFLQNNKNMLIDSTVQLFKLLQSSVVKGEIRLNWQLKSQKNAQRRGPS